MRLFFTQPNSLLGIAINASTLSLVDLSFKKQQYHLLSYATVSLGEGEVVDIQIIDTERMGGRIGALLNLFPVVTVIPSKQPLLYQLI